MSYLFDFTAPARHERLHDALAAKAGEPVPEPPHMPGCERLDVFLAQRFPELQLDPDEVEIRDMVPDPATGQLGWAVYHCGPSDGYWSARRLAFLRRNERPVMVGGFMHIKVGPVMPPPRPLPPPPPPLTDAELERLASLESPF